MLRMGQVRRDPAIAQDACERDKNATPQKPDRPPVVTCVSSGRVRFARPKSESFASKSAPSRMLLGLTSRWMHRGRHSWGGDPQDDVSACASSFLGDRREGPAQASESRRPVFLSDRLRFVLAGTPKADSPRTF
jgi:alkanesulfonate monooxygenase SsuD/methylene tetrahydromethanopterin reductase-like flavin-dependent oxidoreductase (luciferase family)